MRTRILPLLLLLTLPAQAGELVLRSGPARVTLIELFTSQGCNSCPPADAWLGGLQKYEKDLWKTWVPVAFHVDYWNHLGWRDPFSRAEHTVRQKQYADLWPRDDIHTPCLAVNGEVWKGWRRQGRPITGAIIQAGDLQAQSRNDGSWLITFSPGPGSVPLKAHATVLGMGMQTDVTSGENAGQILTENFVALSYTNAPLNQDGANQIAVIQLPTPGQIPAPRHALAVWITRADSPLPIQALGGWLE